MMTDALRRAHSTGRALAIAVLAFAAAACYEHTYTVGAGAPGGVLVHDQWRHHWLWGLIDPSKELVLRDICPSGDATIETEMSFLNGLVSALTSGIYSPTTVQVRCADRRATLDLEAEDVARIVSDPAFLSWVGEVAPDRLTEARSAQLDLRAE
jgi:hypothetical protein